MVGYKKSLKNFRKLALKNKRSRVDFSNALSPTDICPTNSRGDIYGFIDASSDHMVPGVNCEFTGKSMYVSESSNASQFMLLCFPNSTTELSICVAAIREGYRANSPKLVGMDSSYTNVFDSTEYNTLIDGKYRHFSSGAPHGAMLWANTIKPKIDARLGFNTDNIINHACNSSTGNDISCVLGPQRCDLSSLLVGETYTIEKRLTFTGAGAPVFYDVSYEIEFKDQAFIELVEKYPFSWLHSLDILTPQEYVFAYLECCLMCLPTSILHLAFYHHTDAEIFSMLNVNTEHYAKYKVTQSSDACIALIRYLLVAYSLGHTIPGVDAAITHTVTGKPTIIENIVNFCIMLTTMIMVHFAVKKEGGYEAVQSMICMEEGGVDDKIKTAKKRAAVIGRSYIPGGCAQPTHSAGVGLDLPSHYPNMSYTQDIPREPGWWEPIQEWLTSAGSSGGMLILHCLSSTSFINTDMKDTFLNDLSRDIFVSFSTLMSFIMIGDVKNGKILRASIMSTWMASVGSRLISGGLSLKNTLLDGHSANGLPDVLCNATDYWHKLRDAEVIRQFKEVVVKVTTSAVCSRLNVSAVDLCKHVVRAWDDADILASVIGLITKAVQIGYSVYNGIPLVDAINMDNCDKLYVQVLELSSKMTESGTDKQFVLQRLKELKRVVLRQTESKTNSVKQVAFMRLERILKWENKLSTILATGKDKPTPFCVTMTGGGGLGKSKWMNTIGEITHNIKKQVTGIEHEREVGVHNPADDFHSNLYSSTTEIHLNDLGYVNPTSKTTKRLPGDELQMMVDSKIMPFVKADLSEKGVEKNLATTVIISSNHMFAHVTHDTSDVAASARRLGVCMEARIKKEYGVHGQIPDPTTFPDDHGGLGKHCLYRFYHATSSPGQVIPIQAIDKVDGCEWVEADVAIRHIGEKCRHHWKKYLKDVSKEPVSLCGTCCLPTGNGCSCYHVSNSHCLNWVTAVHKYGLLYMFFAWMVPVTILERWYKTFGLLYAPVRAVSQSASMITRRVCYHTYLDQSRNLSDGLSLASGMVSTLVAYKLMRCLGEVFSNRYLQSHIANSMLGQRVLTLDERKNMMSEVKPWVKPVASVFHGDHVNNIESLERALKRNTVKMRTPRGSFYALFVAENRIITPKHAWYTSDGFNMTRQLDVHLNRRSDQVCFADSYTLFLENTAYFDDKDFCYSHVSNCPSVKDLRPYFTDTEVKLGYTAQYLKTNDWKYSPTTIGVKSIMEIKYGEVTRNLEAQRYTGPVCLGDCGSFIIYGDKRRACLLGIVATATLDLTEGGFQHVSKANLAELERQVVNSSHVMPVAEYTGVFKHPVVKQSFSDTPHPKNLVNFLPSHVSNCTMFMGDVGKNMTPRSMTKIHPYKQVFETKFSLPALYPVPMHYRSMREWVGLCSQQPAQLDSTILSKVYAVISQILVGVVEDYKSTGDTVFKTSPYTIDEAVSGINGHPVAHGISNTTSAGEPWCRSKGKLMTQLDDRKVLVEDVLESITMVREAWSRGEIAGLQLKAFLKDEARKPGKDPRIVNGTSIEYHVICRMFLGPLLDLLIAYPDKSRCAVGVSWFGKSWESNVVRSMGKRHCLEFDFAGFDTNIPEDIRETVFRAFCDACIVLYDTNQYDSDIFGLFNEARKPTVHVNGAILRLNSLWISGFLGTAAIGGMQGLALVAYAYFLRFNDNNADDFLRSVDSTCLGDDTLMSSDISLEDWNLTLLRDDLEKIGVKITPSDKTSDFTLCVDKTSATFLKRTTLYNPNFKRLLGALDLSSVLKPFTTIQFSKHVSLTDQMVQQMYSCMIEMSAYGRSSYDKFVSVLKELTPRLGISDSPTSVKLLFPTYKEMVTSLIGEYHDCNGTCFHCRAQRCGFRLCDEIDTSVMYYLQDHVSNMDRTDDAPAVETEGLTTFVTSAENETVIPTPDVVPVNTYSAASALGIDREYRLLSMPFTLNSSMENEVDMMQLFNIPYIKQRMNYIHGIKTDVRFKFLISGSTAHYGKIIASVRQCSVFSNFQDESNVPDNLRNVFESSRQHVIIDVGNHEADNEMIVPIIIDKPSYYPWGNDNKQFPVIVVRTLTPIHHALGLSDPVVVSVFASFTNFHYTCTHNLSNSSDVEEPPSSGLLHISELATVGATLFSGAPEFALPAEIIAAGAGVAGGALRHFGFSRPMHMDVTSTFHNSQPPLANTDLDVNGRSLALTHTHSVCVAGAGRETSDALNISDFIGREAIIGVFPWKKDTAAFDINAPSSNSILFNLKVTPYLAAFDEPSGRFVLTPSGLACTQFQKWRGSMEYSYEVVSSSMFGGKLAFFHDPIMFDWEQTHLNQSLIVDIKDSTMVKHSASWMVNRHALQLPTFPQDWNTRETAQQSYVNGGISCHVHSGLRTLNDVDATAYVIVRAKAHKDMLLFDHRDSLYYMSIVNDSIKTGPIDEELPGSGAPPYGAPEYPPTAFTSAPDGTPTINPIQGVPTATPSFTAAPSYITKFPTSGPQSLPTGVPSSIPSVAATTKFPTSGPTKLPTSGPTTLPTSGPQSLPTGVPSSIPSAAVPTVQTSTPTSTICPIVSYGPDVEPMLTFQTLNPQINAYETIPTAQGTPPHYMAAVGTHTIRVVSFNNGTNPTVSLHATHWTNALKPAFRVGGVDVDTVSKTNNVLGYSQVIFNVEIIELTALRATFQLPVGLKIETFTPQDLLAMATPGEWELRDYILPAMFETNPPPTTIIRANASTYKIDLPTAPQTCLNTQERVMLFYFRGSIGFSINGVLQNWDIDSPNSWSSQVVVISGSDTVEMSASHPGESGILVVKTIVQDDYVARRRLQGVEPPVVQPVTRRKKHYPNSHVYNSDLRYNETPAITEWRTGSPGKEDIIMRLCAGERVGSLRSLLKYLKYVGQVTLQPERIKKFDFYDTNEGANSLFHVLTRSFLGLRGSMMFMYEMDTTTTINSRLVILRNSDSIVDGFESFTTDQQNSLIVKHPYYSIREFEYRRGIPPNSQFPSLNRRLIMSTQGPSPPPVTIYYAICDDFSFVHYMGCPVMLRNLSVTPLNPGTSPPFGGDNPIIPPGASEPTGAPVLPGNPPGNEFEP